MEKRTRSSVPSRGSSTASPITNADYRYSFLFVPYLVLLLCHETRSVHTTYLVGIATVFWTDEITDRHEAIRWNSNSSAAFTPDTRSPDTSCIHLYPFVVYRLSQPSLYPVSATELSTRLYMYPLVSSSRTLTDTCRHCSSGIHVDGYMYLL